MIIALTGKKGSGKDTVANYMCENSVLLTMDSLTLSKKYLKLFLVLQMNN